MSTAVAERPAALMVMTAESVTPEAFDCEIDALKAKASGYQSLTVQGTSDKTGLKAVREARLDLARVRCDIERRRKEIKEGAVVFGRAVDAEAKRLTAMVEPTELALKAIEDDIAKEEQREKDRRTAERMEQLKSIESRYPEVVVAAMSEKDYEKLLVESTADYVAKVLEREAAEKQAKERAEQDAIERAKAKAEEDERKRVADAEVAAEREKLRQQREAQQVEQRRQEAERQRLDAIRAEQDAIERAKAKAEEDERKRVADAQRQAQLEQERAEREAADTARREALKPDYDKLMDVAKALRKLKVPTVSDGATVARNRIKLLIEETASEVEQIAANACGVALEN